MNLPAPAREIAAIARRYSLNYGTLSKAVHQARLHLKLKRPGTGRHLPKLLTPDEVKSFYAAIDSASNLQHQIMLRLLFYTAIRNAELCAIKITDVDLTQGRIFIEQGKGDKDRYVVFPRKFGLTLRSYIDAGQRYSRYTVKQPTYLFESNQRRAFSTRRIQQIVTEYADACGFRVHPHLFRHQMLTHLTKAGLQDSAIQLISGHASKQSLERYQHMALGDVQPDYEQALKDIEL